MTLFLALIVDWFVGDPDSLWKRVPHPVVIIGAAIDWLDKQFNQPDLEASELRGRGTIAVVAMVLASLLSGWVLAWLFWFLGSLGWILEIITVSVFLAQKSLFGHVAAVAISLRAEGTDGGRRAVSQIVGRDPEQLDDPGICRAAIESLAENFSDGVVAPVFWYVILGLPGLLAYKAINTADSMIGHKNEQYLNFGRAAALLDDVVNWPAARLSALAIAIGAGIGQRGRKGFSKLRDVLGETMRDAATHRSPNAGWPEVAMAASLGIALGGPRQYGGVAVQEPMLNASKRSRTTVADIDRALSVYSNACFSIWAMVAIVGLI